jgi:hypothetical protein
MVSARGDGGSLRERTRHSADGKTTFRELGQKLGYFYYEEDAGRRSAAKLLTKDEARRIAVNFAKLPDLLLKS